MQISGVKLGLHLFVDTCIPWEMFVSSEEDLWVTVHVCGRQRDWLY